MPELLVKEELTDVCKVRGNKKIATEKYIIKSLKINYLFIQTY